MYSEREERWSNFISDQYDEYIKENCTCNADECSCISFQEFESDYLESLENQWLACCEDNKSPEYLECIM